MEGVDVRLNTDYFDSRKEWDSLADRIVYSGELDRFYDYRFGRLEYRSLRFEEERLPQPDFQGAAVVNYTDNKTPFTRIIEHKHFDDRGADGTIITREYPMAWCEGAEAYYRLVEDSFLAGNYTDVEKRVYALGECGSMYWQAKMFLTLGDVLAKGGNTFQARATYQSIVDGYTPKDDGIVAEAKQRIATLAK